MNKTIVFLITACFFLLGCQSLSASNLTQVSKVNADIVKINIGNVGKTPQEQATQKYEEFIHTGDTLPIRSIVDIDGHTIDLTDGRKRKLVILFATWCSDSNRALKALNQSLLLNDPTLDVIAIAREESNEEVIKWRNEHHIKVPLAVDLDRSIYKKFAVGGIPRLITVGKDNKVIKMNLAEGQEQLKLIHW